jgi:type VI protein secretion system component VasF
LDRQLVQAVRTRLMAEIPPPASFTDDTAGTDGAASLEPGQVMALIADETLLHDLVWPGQQGWAREPLQALLYGATSDSDEIVQTIDAVAKGEPAAPEALAQTIRLALDLGYLDRPAGAPPAVTPPPPRRLFEIVFRPADPVPAVADDFMTGAVTPVTGLPVMQLPQRRPWLLALAILAGTWLLVSLMLWWLQVGGVVGVANTLLTSLHPAQ